MNCADLAELVSRRAALPRMTALSREAGLRAMLLHLKPGEGLPEHRTRGALLIHCLSGKGEFGAGEDRAALRPGVLISLPPAARHSVSADEQEDLVLMLTLAEQASEEG